MTREGEGATERHGWSGARRTMERAWMSMNVI
jgi:hypothetical protein